MNPIIEALSQLNNRETAIGVWLALILLAMLPSANLRRSLWDILKAVLSGKLLLLFSSMALYLAALVWGLSRAGLWTFDQIAATVLWYFLSGIALLSGVFTAKEDDQYFRKALKGTVAVTGAFEFIVVAFTFSLPIELILVPILALLGTMFAMSATKPEYKGVRVLLEWVLVVFGLLLLWKSAGQIWDDPKAFFTTTTGRNFVLPIFFTIGLTPFLYFWFCYSHIEQARIAINQKTFQSDELKRYARRRFFLIFPLRPWLLKRAVRQFHTLPAKEKHDVNKIIDDILAYERAEDDPPAIAKKDGWSPFVARDFLAEQGLRTNDYHSGWGEEEFWAGSDYVDLDEKLLPNTVAFYLEGDQRAVKTLKLKGHFRDEFASEAGLERFRDFAVGLVVQSEDLNDELAQELLPQTGDFSVSHGPTQIIWSTDRYPSDKGFEITFTLSR